MLENILFQSLGCFIGGGCIELIKYLISRISNRTKKDISA